MYDKIIEPLNSYVIIKKESESTTQSGIVLTGNHDDYNQGVVVSVDPCNCLGLVVGSRVLFDQTNSQATLVNKDKLFMARENQIFGILKG